MKLNEVEMYNAHLWLLTIPRVGISFYLPHSQTFSNKFLHLSEEKCNFAKKETVPTIFIFFGFRFMFYSNDHEPIHVHVIKDGNEAKYNFFL